MELAAPAISRPSWNPLRCDSAELPIEVLLPAKLIALCLVVTQHVALFQTPYLPFLPFLDSLLPPEVFLWLLRITFWVAAAALLLNRRVRWAALALGGVILLAVISSRTYYGNNKLFCGLFLFLAGLSDRDGRAWLLQYQIALVYFGAALNKSLDPDWWSGRFFEYWAIERLEHSLYTAAAAALPPMLLSKFMCWTTIAIEWSLATGFFLRRLHRHAIWLGVLFHSSMLFFTGSTFTMFFYAMTASYLVFSRWPRETSLVVFDGDCGICHRTRVWMERFDLDGRFQWKPFQSGAGHEFGVSDEMASQRLYLVVRRPGEAPAFHGGFRAFQLMLLYNPLFYFVLALLLSLPGGGYSLFRNLVAATAIAFFFPLFTPIGDFVYSLVARNRGRLPLKDRCELG